MRAIVIEKCCKAEELHVCEIPVPEVRPGWVLIKVHAAGLNHSEALLRMYEADNEYINTPVVPGIECVGEVADPSDSHLTKGDKVIALMGGMGRSFNGSYAEYALLPEKNVFRINSNLDWVSLAAVPETYYTAYGSLFECLRLTKDDTLLVRGATSTVGQAAIQLAKAIGSQVIATGRRKSSFAMLQSIGADYCLIDDGVLSSAPYGQELPRPNKILELVGPKTLRDSLLTVSRPGYVCNTGILGNVFTVEHFDPIKYIPNGVFLTGFYSNYPTQPNIDGLFNLINRSGIQPLYNRVFTLDEITQAHSLLEAGGAGGKIILQIW
ncbi:MAG: zinc-binding dehydrogenase [Bacteroidaceae bacterium]|nr:zinc-binding dehydrogenase [Bacteroidaceae bacterium]